MCFKFVIIFFRKAFLTSFIVVSWFGGKMELNDEDKNYFLFGFPRADCSGAPFYGDRFPLGCSTSEGNTRFLEKWVPKNNSAISK